MHITEIRHTTMFLSTSPVQAVAYLGGHWAMPPPLWPEHKNFLNTLNQKKLKNFWGGGTAPSPDSFFSGEGTPPPHTPPHWRLEPYVFGSASPSQNPKYATV